MSQQINLFNPVFLKQKKYFSALTMAQGLALILIGAVLVAVYARLKLHEVDAQAKATAEQLVQTRAQLAKVTADYAPRQKDKALDQQVERLEEEVRAQRQVLAIVRQGEFGNDEGYAEYMRAFARQVIPGVWLTGFSIAGAGTDIELRGRVLRAELAPAYIGRLGTEPSLRGKSFSNLILRQPEDEVRAQPGQVAAPQNREQPKFLEFVLRSSDAPAKGSRQAEGSAQ